MTLNRSELFATIKELLPAEPPAAATTSVSALVRGWLDRGPMVFTGDERRTLDALCRQIDVRKTVSTSYRLDWSSPDTERPVEPSVLSGLVAVLLANAARIGEPRVDALNDGWGLKCTNSALKALDLEDALPREPELRAWGIETLDRLRTPRLGDT